MAQKKRKRTWSKQRTRRAGPMDRMRARAGAGPLAGKQREIVHVPKAERVRREKDAEPAGKKDPAGKTAKPPPTGKGGDP